MAVWAGSHTLMAEGVSLMALWTWLTTLMALWVLHSHGPVGLTLSWPHGLGLTLPWPIGSDTLMALWV